MEPTDDEKHEEARRQLLQEGARSYLDAVSAVIAYRQEVQKMCRTVLEKHLDDYASALNVRLEKKEIEDAAWPSFKKWEGDRWSLGVKVIRKGDTSTIGWWEAWCCLQYVSGGLGLGCLIAEWFSTKPKAIELFRRFHPLNQKVERVDNWLQIRHGLKVEEVCNLEVFLDGVIQQWIELWQKVGGIEKVFEE